MAFVTDPNLLADIKKGDNAAWNLFAKKYGALGILTGGVKAAAAGTAAAIFFSLCAAIVGKSRDK